MSWKCIIEAFCPQTNEHGFKRNDPPLEGDDDDDKIGGVVKNFSFL